MGKRKKMLSGLLTLCLLLTSLSASAQGQKITLSLKKVALPTALRQVEQQSGYYKINYARDEVKDYQVSADIREVTAIDAVHKLLAGLPLNVSVNDQFIQISRNKNGRPTQTGDSKTIRGRVVDSEGEPLPGVTVRIAGTGEGVITDYDGNYTLTDVDPNSTIQYSYIGKRTLERKASAGQSVIILEDDVNLMNDVVVTGYQTISKERATGSFAKVSADDLKSKRYDNLSQLLEGEVAGFNTKTNLIRGTSTMNGVGQPLFVIDGFPVENTRYNEYGNLTESIPDLNINDIESITVLKNAAAASIYGARAANGVVVIVTKKAKEKRTTISFNTSLTYHPYKFYQDRLTDAADIVSLEREWAQSNPYLADEGAADYAQSLLDNNVYTSQGIKAIANYYAGNTSQSQMEQTLSTLAAKGYRYYDDVAKYAKRDAFYQQYHLSVGRASDGNNFMASLTYRNNKMNDRYTDDNSWGVDIRDILDVTPWLKFEFGSYSYFKKDNQQSFDVMNPGYSYQPYDQLKNADGTNYTNTAADRMSIYDQMTLNDYGLYPMDITPLDEISRNIRRTNSFINRTYGKLNVDLPFGLRYNVMFQYEYGVDRTKQIYDKQSYYVRSLVNQYATDDYYTGVATYNIPYGDIYFRANQTSKAYTFRHQLDFDRTFGEKHNVVALVGHEVRKNVIEYDSSTLYNWDDDMLTYSLVEQATLNYTYGLMGGWGLQARNFAYNRYLDDRYISLYANGAYTYDEKYMLTGSIRWDRSNLWGTSSKYQKKPIWSVGAGWNIDREQWFHVGWIDRLKLRASYGIAGNVAKNAAPYMTAYYYENYTLGGKYGSVATRPNPNLRWEKTTTTNIALDFALLKNRLSGSIEYYNKMGTDLLANTMGVPTEGFGYSTYQINNGEMRNRGVELTLSGQILRTKDFDLTATATYSYNKNKVVYVNVEAPFYILQLDYPEAYPVVGNPYNAIYGYHWAGLSEDGLPQIYDQDGEVVTWDPYDLGAIHYIGSTEPTHIASLNLSLRYKQFDLSCLWVYQGGHKMRNTQLPMLSNEFNEANYSYVPAITSVSKDITNRWRQPGDESRTDIPAVIFAENPLFSSDYYDIYRYSDVNVISASNLRLANISLAYNLPRQLSRKAALSNVRIQLNVENAFTLAKSKAAKYLLDGYSAPNYVLGLYLDL